MSPGEKVCQSVEKSCLFSDPISHNCRPEGSIRIRPYDGRKKNGSTRCAYTRTAAAVCVTIIPPKPRIDQSPVICNSVTPPPLMGRWEGADTPSYSKWDGGSGAGMGEIFVYTLGIKPLNVLFSVHVWRYRRHHEDLPVGMHYINNH